MAFSAVVFIFGAILLALGLLGEGISIKDISFPRIPRTSRFILTLLGALFLILGISFGAVEITKDMQTDEPVVVEPIETPAPAEPIAPDPPSSEPVSSEPSEPEPSPQSSPGSSSASADDEEYRAQVTSQLMSMSQGAAERGFTFTDSFVDKLQNNKAHSLTLSLGEGLTYMVRGACDTDCRDIDLLMYDENNNLVSSDEEIDDYPATVVSPAWSGDFTLEIRMPNCAADYCYYGVSLFEKPAATGESS